MRLLKRHLRWLLFKGSGYWAGVVPEVPRPVAGTAAVLGRWVVKEVERGSGVVYGACGYSLVGLGGGRCPE